MSDDSKNEIASRLLSRLPGEPWAVRLDPVTLQTTWLYLSPQAGELYGMSNAEYRAAPFTLLERLVSEDRAQFDRDFAVSLQTLAPFVCVGRIHHSSGTIRWLETRAVFERDEDGAVIVYGQSFDVTDQKRTEQMHRVMIDALPTAVAVGDLHEKFLVYNPAASRYAGELQADHGGDMSSAFGLFRPDGVTPFPNEELPLRLALAGKDVDAVELVVRNAFLPDGCWLRAQGIPLRDENGNIFAGMTTFHDVTAERRLEQELRTRNEELAASEEAKTVLIERLRYSIDELSNPILEIWDDVLVMPIIGMIDSRRTTDMVQRLLSEVTRTQASFVIIDLTGVEIVDTKTADHLMKLMRKVEVVGARCVLTGIRAAVAETLVDIGVDFGRITTLRNLKHGLREALRYGKRAKEGRRDESLDDDPGEGAEAPSGGRARRR
jgi:rsbT co-antagonist protein RsbR